jgi:hypothetical protein
MVRQPEFALLSRSRAHYRPGILICAALAVVLAGCGGQGFGGLQNNLSGDIGSSFGTPIAGQRGAGDSASSLSVGAYPMVEASFKLPSVPGDPFDYEKVNVQVTIRKPGGGTVEVPAFFDGDKTWRARYTPTIPGEYTVQTVRLNHEIAHEEELQPKSWTVRGQPESGFVHIDRGDHTRFVFDDGARYFPIGHNQAWHSTKYPDIPEMFTKMHTAGENWSRVWMDHWDGKNLDWTTDGKSKPGEIDLTVAKRWDTIVQAAEKNNIYFQMVLQHHGQYSSTVDSNWKDNPYNSKNGGFLANAASFFTDLTARTLTRRKLYYILARWGYSPNILAFELFNEVQYTDAMREKRFDDVALWHKEMALFLKQYDLNRHLITTSSATAVPIDSPLWDAVDFVQIHTYPTDVLSALSGEVPTGAKRPARPIFIGEFGPSDLNDPTGVALHEGLWASLMRYASGAAQYWDWESVDRQDLYPQFKAATAYLAASGLAQHAGLVDVTLPIDSSSRADVRFAPGGGFEAAKQFDFVVGSNGVPSGMDRFPAYFQGTNHHDMMPQPLTLQVSYAQPGTFTARIAQVAAQGAHLKVSVDGKTVERDYPAKEKDYAPEGDEQAIRIDVPQGAHTVTIANTGKDWVRFRQFALSNYGPALAAIGRAGRDYAAAWVYHRSNIDAPADRESDLKPTNGTLTLPPLQPGRYRATWWDTRRGSPLDEADVRFTKTKDTVTLPTPSITRDVALYVVRLTDRQEKPKTARRATPETGTLPGVPSGAAGATQGASGTVPATSPTGTAPH